MKAPEDAAQPLVGLDVADGVATVTLDSPRNRNALSRRLLAELSAALHQAIEHPMARVVVLTGAGPAFCSGADLAEQREPRAADDPGPLAALPGIFRQLWECPQPVVCRLNGPVRAGGLGLLASCDLAIAPAGVNFSFTEVRIGVIPAVISVPVLRRVSPQAAHRLFLTGEVFDARMAQQIGLIDVIADGELDTAVQRQVGLLMRGAPEALALTKQLAHTIATMAPGEAFKLVGQLSADRFRSAEGQEGMAAFAEKRDPDWIPPAYGTR